MASNKSDPTYDGLVRDIEDADDDLGYDIVRPKKGHSFCGCCCDVRRATIVLNIYVILSIVITTLQMCVILPNVGASGESLPPPSAIAIIGIVLGLCFSVSGLVGAYTFNAWLVLANVIWISAGFIISPFFTASAGLPAGFDVFMALVRCFFLYPQAMLFYELQISKTMTKRTYASQEEQSCCCVAPTRSTVRG